MSRSAMTALLSVLAVAGYQNRDKIAELIKGLTANAQPPSDPNAIPAAAPDATATQSDPGGLGGLGGLLGSLGGAGGLGGLADILKGGAAGGGLGGSLGGLLEQFDQNGHGQAANSWVQHGPNAEIDDNTLAEALGPDVIRDIAAKTGLSPEDILGRLSKNLPETVDRLTPDGSIPV